MNQLWEHELIMIRVLTQKGWISESVVHEVGDNRKVQIIKWTPYGIERMRKLYGIFDEVGFKDACSNGDLYGLASLCRLCVRQHGPDDSAIR
jgi:hypothetical protein